MYRHTFCLTSATNVSAYEFSGGAQTARRQRNSPFCFLKTHPRIGALPRPTWNISNDINALNNSWGFFASFPALQSCVCSPSTNFHDSPRFGTWLHTLTRYEICSNAIAPLRVYIYESCITYTLILGKVLSKYIVNICQEILALL